MAALISESGATILVEGVLPTICANKLRMFRVVKNLVQNAIKYARPGVPAHIVISAEDFGEQQIMHVRDNGCGISPEFTRTIFAPLSGCTVPTFPVPGWGSPSANA